MCVSTHPKTELGADPVTPRPTLDTPEPTAREKTVEPTPGATTQLPTEAPIVSSNPSILPSVSSISSAPPTSLAAAALYNRRIDQPLTRRNRLLERKRWNPLPESVLHSVFSIPSDLPSSTPSTSLAVTGLYNRRID